MKCDKCGLDKTLVQQFIDAQREYEEGSKLVVTQVIGILDDRVRGIETLRQIRGRLAQDVGYGGARTE